MGEYEHLDVLHWLYKGFLSGLEGQGRKWSKCPKIRLWGTFCTFPFHNTEKLIMFLVELTYGDFGKNISP